VWITYRLSRDLVSAGEQEADALMRRWSTASRRMPNGFTPRALPVRERSGRSGAGANRRPAAQAWTDNIRELEARLQSDRVLRQANQLRDSGDEAQAIALIKQQPPRCAMT
jgi:hypothetical protein